MSPPINRSSVGLIGPIGRLLIAIQNQKCNDLSLSLPPKEGEQGVRSFRDTEMTGKQMKELRGLFIWIRHYRRSNRTNILDGLNGSDYLPVDPSPYTANEPEPELLTANATGSAHSIMRISYWKLARLR